MGILAKKGMFLAGLAAVVGLSLGSLVFSQAVVIGAETDGSQTDVEIDPGTAQATNDQFPQLGGPPIIGQPPAAPIDPAGGGGATGGANAGAVGGDANALPSTGSGGYLNSGTSSLPYALVAFAVAIALTGSMAWVHSRK
ncbi:MAG TPA: hypothetical protein VG845_01940 [Dehalococcoidia bacterium]|nr:hypothetical protein [Dehalococcoidia bacterium]